MSKGLVIPRSIAGSTECLQSLGLDPSFSCFLFGIFSSILVLILSWRYYSIRRLRVFILYYFFKRWRRGLSPLKIRKQIRNNSIISPSLYDVKLHTTVLFKLTLLIFSHCIEQSYLIKILYIKYCLTICGSF